jgi:hypothetical protein
MDQEMKIEVRPVGGQIVANQRNSTERRPDLERNVSVASDGRVRSKFQMFAILTALFVSQYGDFGLASLPACLADHLLSYLCS